MTWQDKEIRFPEQLQTKYFGKDTVCPWLWQKDYRILVFLRNEGCTSCKLKLPSWKQFIREVDSLNLNVSFLFVVSLKNYEELEFLQKENNFEYPFIYDYQNKMDKLNSFPDDLIFQTFLLNKENKVRLIGNPVFIEKLWPLYKNTILNNK